MGALAAVGTTDGPEVQVLKDCPHKSEAICTRTTSRRSDQPDGVVPRNGKERLIAHDAARQTLVTDIEQSEGRLERFRAAAAAADAIPRPRPPADVETQVQGLQHMVNQLQEERDAGSRVVWKTHGAPQGQAEIVTCTPKWSDPSHAHFDSWGPYERRELWEDPRVDINVVERCREGGRDDRRSDNAIMIEEKRHSRYGLRGVRIGEAWAPIVASVSRRGSSSARCFVQRRAIDPFWQERGPTIVRR